MEELRFRQVHLDFHTSEAIPKIGKNFSKKQFQEMLKLGHVDSITVFSKCHHGWAYHPSLANETHPNLEFDLLKEMIDAAHEINVLTPVYLSAGLDEKLARKHPEWLTRLSDESIIGASDFMKPGYHTFCMNSPYLDYLLKQIEEVVGNYEADGIFLDIISVRSTCRCQNCVESIRKEGKDPRDVKAMEELAERVYANYTKRVEEVVHSLKPNMRIFHNGGHIRRGRRDLAHMNTHLELESLPTGCWGYDHFPLSARYVQGLGMDFLGMTGKFHTWWGEFGGYKHPNALRYEVALSIANGAKCSIGDQLHPEGLMDEVTYKLIGIAYSEVEKKEAWCSNVKSVAEVAILSSEAFSGEDFDLRNITETVNSDIGAARILLEGKILFDVIDLESDFNKYKVVILPDAILINQILKEKFDLFFENGGMVFASGESGLNTKKSAFELDFGVKYLGENPYRPDYFRPDFTLKSIGNAAFVSYSEGQRIELDGGEELGKREDPYFNRELFAFCSHQHTPSSLKYGGPGMVKSKSGIYFAWNVFQDYATSGSLFLKESVLHALDILLGRRKLETNLPAQGVVTLMRQESKRRYVNHLLYASPVKRGEKTEIIEDILPVYNVEVSVEILEHVKNVYLAPQMQNLEFIQVDQRLCYTVPVLECHQMVVIDFKER
jgi:hypothetical protein